MSALTIAGTDYPVASANATGTVEQIGTSSRTFDGSLRSTVRAEKLNVTLTTGLLTQSAFEGLASDIADAAHVTVSGDMIGASITAEVTLGACAYVAANGGDGLGFMRQAALTIREV